MKGAVSSLLRGPMTTTGAGSNSGCRIRPGSCWPPLQWPPLPRRRSRVSNAIMRSRILLLALLGSCATANAAAPDQLLFDDFSYSSLAAFAGNGWIARTAAGWPGVEGAIWVDSVSLIDDPALAGNRLVRMTATTDGKTTHQAQFCHQRK